MHSVAVSDSDKLLASVVHDLRQPLSHIGTLTYCLGLSLGPENGRAQEHLRAIERQVDEAARILSEAVAGLGRLRAQRTDAGESLVLTKSQTAAVA